MIFKYCDLDLNYFPMIFHPIKNMKNKYDLYLITSLIILIKPKREKMIDIIMMVVINTKFYFTNCSVIMMNKSIFLKDLHNVNF